MTRRRALAALLAVFLVAACGDDSKPPPRQAPEESTFYLPTFLPAGFKVQSGSITARGPKREVFGNALGRPVGPGKFDGVILVTATEAAADREVAANEKTETVDIGGIRARRYDDNTLGAYVDWFANGVAVSVSGSPGTGALLVDVARGLRGDRLADMTLASIPAGYVSIAGGHFVGYAPDAGTTLQIAGPPGAAISMTTAQTPVPLVFAVAGGDHVESTTVRGHEAMVSTRARDLGGTQFTQRFISWIERPGFVISLVATAPTEQLIPVADGLVRVTEAEWRTAVPQGP